MLHESKAPTPVWRTTPKQKSFLKILLLVLCVAIFKMMFFNNFIPNKTVSFLRVVFKKLCHFLKLLKTGMMHYGNYI